MKPSQNESKSLDLLRTIALAVLAVGAVGSLGLTLYTGRRNESTLLMLLFAGWVLSPFAGLAIATVISSRWSATARMAIYLLCALLAACSVFCYSGLWSPAGTKTAFVFLVFPGLSWVMIAMVVMVNGGISRKKYPPTT